MPIAWRIALIFAGVFTFVSTATSILMLAYGFKGDDMTDPAFSLVIIGYALWLITGLCAANRFNTSKWPLVLTLLHPFISAVAFFASNWQQIFGGKPDGTSSAA